MRFTLASFGLGVALAALAAGVTALLLLVLRPWMRRYALALPNARGLHTEPTPQGGGVAVFAATCCTTFLGGLVIRLPPGEWHLLASVLAGAAILAVVGAIDDVSPLPALPRLLAQLAIVAFVIFALPDEFRLFPFAPAGIERGLLVVAGVWYVNLVNFMDGMDWMTFIEMAPICAALAILSGLGSGWPAGGLMAVALLGALIGFAPFNAPVARLFLGDVGSLPIGLVTGMCLVLLAGRGHLAAAFLLPLYYLADSALTLLWRLRHGERIWRPHRNHFYQVAVSRGMTVWQVIARVLLTNLVLVALACASVGFDDRRISAVAVIMGSAVVGLLLWRLGRGVRGVAGGRYEP